MSSIIELGSIKLASGLDFRCRFAGPVDGEPVICLHGFPESSISYMPLLEAISSSSGTSGRGYRVIAPDQRGYSPGARPDPADPANYHYDLIVDDVIAIADTLKINRFHLVAHDHGCVAGWCVAARYPQRVASFVAMSIPHPAAFTTALLSDPAQQRASQYFHSFVSTKGEALAKMASELGSRQHSQAGFTEEYSKLFSDPNTLRAALNWYNGMFESGVMVLPPLVSGSQFEGDAAHAALVKEWQGQNQLAFVTVPVRHLWGAHDTAIARRGIEASGKWCTGGYELVVVECGHEMMQEAGEECVQEILLHIGANMMDLPTSACQ